MVDTHPRKADSGHAHPVRRLGALALAGLTALSLAACSGGDSDREERDTLASSIAHPAYLVGSELRTANAASNLGVSTSAEVVSGRIYPGIYASGPAGQMIPNTDLATTQVLPGDKRTVIYTLTEQAKYADGVPITCTDFLLSFKAGVLSDLFDSHLPLTRQVERLDCTPGAKKFSVTFRPGQGGRWRNLFGPGEVLPAHAIARKAGVSQQQLTDALLADDRAALEPVATVWREGFNLDHFDPELQVSAGPYRIDEVGARGEVVLLSNQDYFGDPARIGALTLWPAKTDGAWLASKADVIAADLTDHGSAWLNRDDPANTYDITAVAGRLTDTLVLAPGGIFADEANRQALAACIDHAAVARISSEKSGIEVPAVGAHVVSYDDPAARHLAGVTDPHLDVDVNKARKLEQATVRIGYQGPNERYSAMVESIRQSCAPAGITVVNAAGDNAGLGDLEGVTPYGSHSLDAVLMAVDPEQEYGQVPAAGVNDDKGLYSAEEQLWNEVPDIPLSAQPRSFASHRKISNITAYTGVTGLGWNLDRWQMS